MLSLLDPVQIDNLSLFRDDNDPRKFYLLPDKPVISNDDEGNPDFVFIHYIKNVADQPDTATADSMAAGYVQFRTSLALSDERRTKVEAALRTQLAQEKAAGKQPFGNAITTTEPLLASPLWNKGTVHLETFKVGDTELVRVATDTVPVDLAGALGASVRLQLSGDGAEVFWASFKSFKDQQIPIIIRYELTYQARVSANMTIHADRSTVIKQIWEGAAPQPARFIIATRRWAMVPHVGAFTPTILLQLQKSDPTVQAVSKWSDVRKAIHSSVTSGAIEVKIDIGAGADGPDNKVQQMLFQLATDLLTNKVVPTIFGDPADQPSGDSDGTTTGPNSPDEQLMKLPPISTTDTTESKFDMNFSSTTVIEQSCSPNAPVHLLLDDPAKLDACFKELRLADGYFAAMRVAAATAGVNFAQDGVSQVHVHLDYTETDEMDPTHKVVQRSHDDVLKSETDVIHWKFDTVRDSHGAHKKAYRFRTDVYYGNALKVMSRPTDWIPATDEMLLITPRHMGVLRVQCLLTARRDQVQAARVTLSATTSSGGQLRDVIELSPDAAAKTWLRATGELVAPTAMNPAPLEYTYQVTYIVNNNEIAMPEETSTSDGLDLTGPFTRLLHFIIMPQGSFEGVASISGTATYTDPATGYTVLKPYKLDSLGASVPFDVPTMANSPDTIHVTSTINRLDGSQTALPPATASQGEVRVGPSVARYLEIQVQPALIDFNTDVQLALVQLAYNDSAAGDMATTLQFNKASPAAQSWKVPLRDGATLDYEVDIQYIAYDRSKSSEVHTHPVKNGSTKAVLLLDRAK